MMRRAALVLLFVPAYVSVYVLRYGGIEGRFQVSDYNMSGARVLVAAWATAIALIGLSHAVWVDLDGKRRVLTPLSGFASIGCLVVALVMIGASGSTFDWTHLH